MTLKISLRLALLSCALFVTAGGAQAQVRYTFVSMIGSDANNCLSATTACRTFQRAHDVVSDGGTVVARDSGGYGPINITKSVTITGEGVMAGITVTGVDVIGISINTPGVVVRLRHLNIIGLNTSGSSFGVFYANGAAVHVEHCLVRGFSTYGLVMNTPGRFYVSDSFIANNGDAAILIGGGAGAGASSGSTTVERTILEQNSSSVPGSGSGLAAFGGRTTIRKSRTAGNGSVGVGAVGAGVEVTVDDCNISHNSFGISAQVGGTVRVANSIIANNNVGLFSASGGQILTRAPASNTVEGNTTDGSFTGTYPAQ